jgi:hypothetical protein
MVVLTLRLWLRTITCTGDFSLRPNAWVIIRLWADTVQFRAIIPYLRELIENPTEIWVTPQKNAKGRHRLTRVYLGVFEVNGEKVAVQTVFEMNNGRLEGVTAFSPGSMEIAQGNRSGILLYNRPGNG